MEKIVDKLGICACVFVWSLFSYFAGMSLLGVIKLGKGERRGVERRVCVCVYVFVYFVCACLKV